MNTMMTAQSPAGIFPHEQSKVVWKVRVTALFSW